MMIIDLWEIFEVHDVPNIETNIGIVLSLGLLVLESLMFVVLSFRNRCLLLIREWILTVNA